MGIIYKLEVGNYYYIGKTINSFRKRYNQHKKSCFNKCNKTYHSKVYKKFRELKVKKNNWNEMVKYKIIYKCDNVDLSKYEKWCINIKNINSLNTNSC